MKLSVVICTYKPKVDVFETVLSAIRNQTLPGSEWELIVVDNCSPEPVADRFSVDWHSNGRILLEPVAGLAHARAAGIKASRTDLIVFVDDDNVLAADYLANSLSFAQLHPEVGCFGGRSLPVFETAPPQWFTKTGINLGCQDFGDEQYISNFAADNFRVDVYPQKAPIGTGMVIRKAAFEAYLRNADTDPERMKLGRKGEVLSSGEDNDIILSLIKSGYEIAYVPQLVVQHLIPANRYSQGYLEKMAFESNRTWVKVLQLHGINPWKRIPRYTYQFRVLKSFVANQAWKSPLSSIRWKSAAGKFKGLSEL